MPLQKTKLVPAVFRSIGACKFDQLFDKDKMESEDKDRRFNYDDLWFGIVDGDDKIVDAHFSFEIQKS